MRMHSILPASKSLIVAIATPLLRTGAPDVDRMAAHCRSLSDEGCDGFIVFGTTGEGASFSDTQRMVALDSLITSGIDPSRLVVVTTALSVSAAAALTRHAAAHRAAGVMVMPPCYYRGGLTEEGIFRYFATLIEAVGNDAIRLYLYHFPDISGAPVSSGVIRRLEENYSGIIAGIKDSGGDLEFTQELARQFKHLEVYTGTEVHAAPAVAAGARGTMCGLGNVIPRLLRAMLDAEAGSEQQNLIAHVQAIDEILSRGSFLVSVKAAIAAAIDDPKWREVQAPLRRLPAQAEEQLASDVKRIQLSLSGHLRERAYRTAT
jgi:4-hydroxy-tetrahydrodipicolinate synthase